VSKLPFTETRIWTEPNIRFAQRNPDAVNNSKLSKKAGQHVPALNLSEGGVLFFASTQPKKFYEIEQVLKHSASGLQLSDAIDVLHWFHSADETSKTYLGNAYEKAEAILDRIYEDIGYQQVAARIRELGHDPHKIVFGVNDTGSSFNVDYSAEPEFQRSLHEKGLGAWPGVELGPVTDAQGGMKGFYSALNKMKKRKEAAGEDVDLSGSDDNMYLFFKLVPDRKDVKLVSFYSEVPLEHMVQPVPRRPKDVLTSFHFSRATGFNIKKMDQRKSREQLGAEYVGTQSSQAEGFRRFLAAAQVPQSTKVDFKKAVDTKFGPAVIATHHNALPDTIKNWLPNAIYREDGLVTQEGQVNTIENGAYQRLTMQADAVILGEHHRDITRNYDQYVLDLFDMWCSLHVDKQLRVETFENTPFFVLNRDNPFVFEGKSENEIDWDDPEVERGLIDFMRRLNPNRDPWQAFALFNQYLHEKGFVKQEPRFLHSRFDPEDPAFIKTLKAQLDTVRGVKTFIPKYQDESWGHDRHDLFEVSVLGSASTRVEAYTQPAREFGYWAASQGWHVRTGGGRYGIMGAVSHGALDYLNEKQGSWPKGHLSAIQMPRTIQFEGAVFKQNEIGESTDRFLRIADSFDSRMASLFRSNISVAMAPGIGTYQEVIRFIRLREAGYEPLQDKKMVLVNHEQSGGGDNIRLMDPFLALIPEQIIDRHAVIVPDVGSAMVLVNEAHQEWQMAKRYEKERKSAPAARLG